MFKEKFIKLCANKGVAPSFVVKQVGISSAAFSQWTDQTIPRQTTLLKIADYFGVSVDYLLGKDEKNAPGKVDLTEGEKEWLDFFRQIPEEHQPLTLEVFKTFRQIPEDRRAEALELLQVALRMQKRS